MLERAPRNGILERVPRNGISEGVPKNGVPERASKNGVPERASKNGVSERAPYIAVESVIFHQLPTSVTLRNGRATFFVSVIPSYSVEWRMHAVLLLLLPFRPSHRLPLLLLPLFTVRAGRFDVAVS